MTTSRIRISYSAPTNFLASDQWIQIRTALEEHLPLRSLYWKPSASGSTPSNTGTSVSSIDEMRTQKIDKLQVDLVALDAIKDEGSSQVPSSVLERPLVNLYFFPCEDNESYKNIYKKLVKDWQTLVTNPIKRHQEWLVVLVIRPDFRSSSATSRIFSMRAPVLEKVKADINTDKKKERCVELVWPMLLAGGNAAPANSGDDGWKEVEEKLKEAVIGGFESYVSGRREEIAKSEGQRLMPGWNFCTYFILKESLASSFDGMGLLDEALQVYIELEASFFQALHERNLPWFGNLGGTAAGDDSRSILSTSSKPYHDLILANTITLFDFRTYLFAKQMALLGKMGRVRDVLTRGKEFIVGFARNLRESEACLPSFTAFFMESWIYSACLNTVSQCDRALEVMKESATPNATFIAQYAAAKGELVELARHQLDKIGVHLGYLAPSPPFSLSLPSTFSHPRFANGEKLNSKITRPELVETLGDKDAFDGLYVRVTQDAIDCFVEGKRRKWALKLHGDLAAFDLSRGNFPTAHQTYASLPAHYAPPKHPWPPLEAFVLARSLDAHVKAGRELDRAWLENALTFLGSCVTSEADTQWEGHGMEGIGREGRTKYLEGLVGEIRNTADGLEEELIRSDVGIFSLSFPSTEARLAGDQDGSYLDVIVVNHLSCDISIERVSLVTEGEEDTQFTYEYDSVVLHPGNNSLSLFCPDSHTGTFALSHVSIWISKVHLRWRYPNESSEFPPPNSPLLPAHVSLPHTKPIVRIPVDKDALDVKLSLPKTIQWDAAPAVMLSVHSGRNDIEEAIVRVHGPTGVVFRLTDVALLGDSDSTSLVPEESHVTLQNIHRGQVVSFAVPHSPPPAGSMLSVSISIEYTTKSSDEQTSSSTSDLRRKFSAVRRVSTALPLQVSVMDSFRGKTLISRFTVSSTSHLQVRVKETQLVGGTGLKIRSPRKGPNRVSTMVTPQRPAHFLYQLESESPRYERETLHLHITYRTMREEIELRLQEEVQRAFEEHPDLIDRAQALLVDSLATDASWVQLYIHAEELNIPVKGLDAIPAELQSGIRAVLENLKKPALAEKEDEEGWQKLVIPVDLPFMHILCAVEFHLQGDLDSIYAGQPVPIRLEIFSSFHWGAVSDASAKEYRMRYAVQESVTDWLVSGHKRGDFVATDEGTHSVELTLVPLHHGELAMPTLSISPLSRATTASYDGGMHNASVALPSTETYHVRAAHRVMVLPRGGRSTFVVGMGGDE
ncbi:hypothetical protein M408DRAFT_322755 [Serendipita vermifera MAFF 305830]|uniref:Trafficking protein particle complex subunit 10 n=1 Tax=Serendipita vermifera MAFF 305830 TaxID=933852 RepID=A0A0C3ADC1_SERVB|nr:hypothetical protein M408DRAFT_322755 [Serendipita vermifera MAFF 305830]